MKIGVVILTYNGIGNTLECIDSLNKSSLKKNDLVIAVVDNNSDYKNYKNLKNSIDMMNNVILLRNSENLGYSLGCNVGIRYLLNQYELDKIIVSNDDLIYDDNFMNVLYHYESNNEMIGPLILCYPDKNIIWSAGGYIDLKNGRGMHYNKGSNVNNTKLEKRNCKFISGACLIVPANILKETNGLPESYFFGGEEWEYSLQVKKMGYNIIFDPNLIIYHKVKSKLMHGSSHNYTNPFFVYNGITTKFVFMNRNAPFFWKIIWRNIYYNYVKRKYLDSSKFQMYLNKIYSKKIDSKKFIKLVKLALTFKKCKSITLEDIKIAKNIMNESE
ncbi:glycosyltransferase family 2 protein [Clostridium tyrobutyricum]|uniref:glycosyltransferase family 2 protein n=1 Tax=Clostridium tyrobutyricum TaxID=1519 RepID=UPI00242C2477|nr:glycosyltransferase family 2 protein [Clostridium tyrobutyricum]